MLFRKIKGTIKDIKVVVGKKAVVGGIFTLVFGFQFYATVSKYTQTKIRLYQEVSNRRMSDYVDDEYIVTNNKTKWTLDISRINTTFLMDQCRVKNHSVCLKFFEPRPTNKFIFNVTIDGGGSCPGDTEIVILIPSLHSNIATRTAHRDTWVSAARSNQWPWGTDDNGVTEWRTLNTSILVRFVFGTHQDPILEKTISKESEMYGDVIQGDFAESYENLTLKSLLMLKWMSTYCPNAKYMVKLDDDVFLNVPVLVRLLRRQMSNWTVLGYHNYNAKIYTSGKWAVTPEEYPFNQALPFAGGALYALTNDVIHPLLVTSELIRWFRLEDQYITGILGHIIQINRVHNEYLKRWSVLGRDYCSFRRRYPLLNDGSVTTIYSIWDALLKEKQSYCRTR